MGMLDNATKALQTATRGLERSKTTLDSLSKLNEATMREIMGTVNGSLPSMIRGMLVSNFRARGITNPVLLSAAEQCEFDINATRVRVKMPSGLVFPPGPRGGKKGNPYAALSLLDMWQLTDAQQEQVFRFKADMLKSLLAKYGLEAA